MSVLVPDLQVYNYLANAAQRAAYNRTCDEFYSYSMSRHFQHSGDIEKEIRRLVKSWLLLNEMSWNYRYKEHEKCDLHKFIKWEVEFHLQPYQIIKYVKCVLYNIEIETITEGGGIITEQMQKDYELLKDWELDILNAILSTHPLYEKAAWSDYKPLKLTSNG